MALDEPTETDSKFEIDGFNFLVDKDFFEKVKPIKIDFLAHGFKLDCDMTFESGCTSCGTSGSCST